MLQAYSKSSKKGKKKIPLTAELTEHFSQSSSARLREYAEGVSQVLCNRNKWPGNTSVYTDTDHLTWQRPQSDWEYSVARSDVSMATSERVGVRIQPAARKGNERKESTWQAKATA